MTLGHCSHLLDSSHLNSPNKGHCHSSCSLSSASPMFLILLEDFTTFLIPILLGPSCLPAFQHRKCPQEEFYTLAVSNFSPPGVFWSNSNQVFIFTTEALAKDTNDHHIAGSCDRVSDFMLFNCIYFLHEIPAWIWDILLMFSHLPGHSASVFYDDFLDCPTSRHLSHHFQSWDIKNHLYTKNTYIFISNPALFPEYQMYV